MASEGTLRLHPNISFALTSVNCERQQVFSVLLHKKENGCLFWPLAVGWTEGPCP